MPGTLDLLILKALSLGRPHGYGIVLLIQQVSGDKPQTQYGCLYSALYRLKHHGVIASEWGQAQGEVHPLTAADRRRLREEIAYWHRLSDTIGTVLMASQEDL